MVVFARLNLPNISMTTIRDGVVSKKTNAAYVCQIFFFMYHLLDEAPHCLTDHSRAFLNRYRSDHPNLTLSRLQSLVKVSFQRELRAAIENPVVVLEEIKPLLFMDYVATLRHGRRGAYLSKSAYGNRRASLFHLFRLHNGHGYSEEFKNSLTHLFKGFYRALAQNGNGDDVPERLVAVDDDDNFEEDNVAAVGIDGAAAAAVGRDVHQWNQDESKKAMSVELYRALCKWFLDRGTPDGHFAHAFLVMTWNLACRINNTKSIKVSDICWSTHFDCFHVFFAHSKTDQTGDESTYPRFIFANHVDPLVCPVMALAMYFTTCFSIEGVKHRSKLFPGPEQNNRFSRMLMDELISHEAELRMMGFSISDIGPHSIRKGAASYLGSLPGGPSIAAVSIRGGWSMGGVKDRYFKYADNGDQFVGRCLALLPLNSIELAASPPHFTIADDWINTLVMAQFSAHKAVPGYGRLLVMMLASMLKHHRWIAESFHENHCLRTVAACYKDNVVMDKVRNDNVVIVTYPWNDPHHAFTGVPPSVSLLQELAEVKSDQKSLIDSFVDRVTQALDAFGIDGDRLSEQRLRLVLDEFTVTMRAELSDLRRTNRTEALVEERVENNDGYKVHTFDGIMHRVPPGWNFPRCGVKDLWRQWWIGDKERHVHPLRHLDIKDVKHIDDKPLSIEEKHRRVGKFKEQRRSTYKQLSDMRFIMKYITNKVIEHNLMALTITYRTVDDMFALVSDKLNVGERNLQKAWLTVVREVRKKKIT